MVTPAESNDQLGITPTYIPLIAVDCLEQQCIPLANSARYPGAEYPYFDLSTSRTSLALATAFPRPSGRPLRRRRPHPISVIDSATVGLLTRLPRSHPQSVVFSGVLKPASCKANAVAAKPVTPFRKYSSPRKVLILFPRFRHPTTPTLMYSARSKSPPFRPDALMTTRLIGRWYRAHHSAPFTRYRK